MNILILKAQTLDTVKTKADVMKLWHGGKTFVQQNFKAFRKLSRDNFSNKDYLILLLSAYNAIEFVNSDDETVNIFYINNKSITLPRMYNDLDVNNIERKTTEVIFQS